VTQWGAERELPLPLPNADKPEPQQAERKEGNEVRYRFFHLLRLRLGVEESNQVRHIVGGQARPLDLFSPHPLQHGGAVLP